MNRVVVLRWYPYKERYDISVLVGVYTNYVSMCLAKDTIQTDHSDKEYDVSENAFDEEWCNLNDVIPQIKVPEKEDYK